MAETEFIQKVRAKYALKDAELLEACVHPSCTEKRCDSMFYTFLCAEHKSIFGDQRMIDHSIFDKMPFIPSGKIYECTAFRFKDSLPAWVFECATCQTHVCMVCGKEC